MLRKTLLAVACLVASAAATLANDWWAYRPLRRPSVPPASSWARTPIDAFVEQKLRSVGLEPSPEADRRTLIRRLYIDLLGLPPAYSDVERFLHDRHPAAHERLVDRLLASPHYGERWARHWLDVAHYADTHGFDKDKVRWNAWPYRDYVVRAFNEDRPYSRFVLEQIAGDVLFPDDPDGIVATGFLVAGPFDWVGQIEVRNGTVEKRRVRYLDRDDMVSVVFNAFLSTTIQCARCHEHKFDPISQEEYYGLQAIFSAIDRADRPYDPDPSVAKRRAELEARRAQLRRELDAVNRAIQDSLVEAQAQYQQRLQQLNLAVDPSTKRPQYGYHSAIEPTPHCEKWVQVDLGSLQDISLVVLFPCHDNFAGIGAGFGFPVRYRVEISSDPAFTQPTVLFDCSSWDAPNPGLIPQAFAPPRPVRGRYVRVTVTKLAERKNDYIFALAELKVFDAAGREVSRGAQVTAADSIEAPPRWSRRNLVDGIQIGTWPLRTLQRLASIQTELREAVQNAVPLALRQTHDRLAAQLGDVEKRLQQLPKPRMVFAAATRFKPIGQFVPTNGTPRPVFVLRRGDVQQPVARATPQTVNLFSWLPGDLGLTNETPEGRRRAALARWVAHRDNPLTWRSIVNRVWHYHFGRGIVATTNDFGRMGELPTHPELLDWLAVWFRDDAGERLKRLHRLIVTSSTYRQTSKVVGAAGHRAMTIDANNRWLWRMNRRRLEAEVVRDAALAVAGILERSLGGPPYMNFKFIDDHSPHYLYDEYRPHDMESRRRSLYRLIVRSVPDPFMEAFDCPDPAVVTGRRNETLTPLQALTLFNDPLIIYVCRQWADALDRAYDMPEDRVRAAVRAAFGRDPAPDELELLTGLARRHGTAYVCRVLINANEFIFVD